MQTLECISQKWHYNIAEMVFFNHNIMLQAQCVWKRYFGIMTWEGNLWSDIRWNQQACFLVKKKTLLCNFGQAMSCLWHSLTLTLTQKDKASSTSEAVIFYGLWKNRCTPTTPVNRDLCLQLTLPSFPIHIKTPVVYSGGCITCKSDVACCYGSASEEL